MRCANVLVWRYLHTGTSPQCNYLSMWRCANVLVWRYLHTGTRCACVEIWPQDDTGVPVQKHVPMPQCGDISMWRSAFVTSHFSETLPLGDVQIQKFCFMTPPPPHTNSEMLDFRTPPMWYFIGFCRCEDELLQMLLQPFCRLCSKRACNPVTFTILCHQRVCKFYHTVFWRVCIF